MEKYPIIDRSDALAQSNLKIMAEQIVENLKTNDYQEILETFFFAQTASGQVGGKKSMSVSRTKDRDVGPRYTLQGKAAR